MDESVRVQDEVPQNEQEVSYDVEEIEQHNELVNEIKQDDHKILKRDTNHILPQSTSKNKRKIDHDFLEVLDVNKHLKQATNALKTLAAPQVQPPQDSFALYGQLLADKLRRLSKKNQIILQNKIDNLVFQTEFSEIENESTSSTSKSNLFSSLSYVPSSSPLISQENIDPNINLQSINTSVYYSSASDILDIS